MAKIIKVGYQFIDLSAFDSSFFEKTDKGTWLIGFKDRKSVV